MNMKRKFDLARISLYFVSIVILLFGLRYFIYPSTAMVIDTLGKDDTTILIPALFRVIGITLMSIGIGIMVLINIYFRKGYGWAKWMIISLTLVVLIPSVFLNLTADLHTSWGMNIPWWVPVFLILLVVATATKITEVQGKSGA